MIGRRLPAAVLTAATVAVAGCGGHASSSTYATKSSSTSGGPDLTVSAAASLRRAFTEYGRRFAAARARFSFAGSDLLAAQIQRGVRPDVFAAANTQLPQMLYARGLVSRPVEFAANRLVLAVPAGSTRVRRLADVERQGVTIAIGAGAVPIGSYTRRVLTKLGTQRSSRILANVRSEEPDVSGIVGKLTEGAVDAGFTYVTDVRATGRKLRAIALPSSAQPVVAYAAAVVKGAPHPAIAARFISGLLHGTGRSLLLESGFLPPPR